MLYLKWQQIVMVLKMCSIALMGSGWLLSSAGRERGHQVYSKEGGGEGGEEQKYNPEGTKTNVLCVCYRLEQM